MLKEYNIDGVNIPYDTDWGDIAISVSGGADSALLAYLLINEIIKNNNTEIHFINHIRMWKTRPWQNSIFHNVVGYLEDKACDDNFHSFTYNIHQNFIAPELEYGNIGPTLTDEYGKLVSGDNIQIRAYGEYICDKHDILAYYNAVTCNPKGVLLDKAMIERDVEPNENNEHLRIMKHMGRYAIHPFRFVDKSWVVRQYKRLNIMDLFNITKSCEGDFPDVDYRNYNYGDYGPVCNECYWCKERMWALLQN
jgi:hypothetical protein